MFLNARSNASSLSSQRCYAMELKPPGGRATPAQREMLARLEVAGASTCIAEGLDAALAKLEGWGVLWGKTAVRVT